MEGTTLTARLAVATPALADPNFAHTAVLILEHGPEGAVGVVLNRPSRTPVAEALPAWGPLSASPSVVFAGGPVQPEALVALGRAGGPAPTVRPVGSGLGIVDLSVDPPASDHAGQVRLFAGYAGWQEGQLEQEIAAGGWFVVDAQPDDALTAAPDRLWRSVLLRQGGVFRTIPEDPGLN